MVTKGTNGCSFFNMIGHLGNEILANLEKVSIDEAAVTPRKIPSISEWLKE